mmetsp:Transcript_102037/g.329136  ORF Transcript_102037/g.329136 Transcript_102037/m.329136 type:complete len:450 (+) Transcript_102037:93-1442(+)
MCIKENYVLKSGFDSNAFLSDMKAAKEAVGESGPADARHLEFLVGLDRGFACMGYVLVILGASQSFSLLPGIACVAGAILISTGRCMRWVIIGHHVTHGGYDQIHKNHPGVLSKHYKRGIFGTGCRRFIDWLDWMLPGAWDVEHNKMHHYYLSEDTDPDLVERNFAMLHTMPLPSFVKYASMLFWMFTWKATYYSPNTFKELEHSRKNTFAVRYWPQSRPKTEPLTVFDFAYLPFLHVLRGDFKGALFWPVFFIQWLLVVIPMMVLVVLPAAVPPALGVTGLWPFALEWQRAALKTLVFSVAADLLSNAHSFVIVACNHSGEDLYRYSTSCKAYSAEWFLRCSYSSVNFETGNDFVDIFYGWLNYQIEHHMFPDMTPLQYRKLQPLVKSVCKKHGVQYIQQNGFWRTWKMLRCAVGDDKMVQCDAILPPKAEDKQKAAAEVVLERAMGS